MKIDMAFISKYKILLLCCFIGTLTILFSFRFLLINSDAYQHTLNTIKNNEFVQTKLGKTISTRFLVGGRVGYNAANLQIPIYGKNGQGTIEAVLRKEKGKWTIVRLKLIVNSEKEYDLLQ